MKGAKTGINETNELSAALKWPQLAFLAGKFRNSLSANDLSCLLDAWESYWNGKWDHKPPTLNILLEKWRQLALLVEAVEEDNVCRFRFVAANSARTLAHEIKCELFTSVSFSQFIIVNNAELCFFNVFEKSLATIKGYPGLWERWLRMVLVNRVMLALERFAIKTAISEGWQYPTSFPHPIEVMINRVERVLKISDEQWRPS